VFNQNETNHIVLNMICIVGLKVKLYLFVYVNSNDDYVPLCLSGNALFCLYNIIVCIERERKTHESS